jgi:hypothetical protein
MMEKRADHHPSAASFSPILDRLGDPCPLKYAVELLAGQNLHKEDLCKNKKEMKNI